MIYFTGFPCWYCGVRSNVPCRHRVTGDAHAYNYGPKADGRALNNFQGLHFKIAQMQNKKGNSPRSHFKAITETK